MTALRKEKEELKYRAYVTDALQVIAENTAKNGGKYPTKRYVDIAAPLVPEKEETRTAEDVINGIKEKLKRLK